MEKLYRIPMKYIYAATIFVCMMVVAAAFYSSTGLQQPVADPNVLSVQQECQLALSYEGRSADDIDFLTKCVHALTPPTITPTPTVVPTTVPSTPTPTPTPTTTGPMIGCAPHPSVCGFPDASNTGVPAGTILTPFSGSITAGMTITGKTIGCLTINVPNVTIKNSRIAGQCFYGIRSNSSGLVVQDSEISCNNSQGSGIAGKGYSLIRDEITGCENGAVLDRDAQIMDSFVHDMFLGQGGHTDSVQVYGGAANILIQHNTLLNEDDGGTSAIIADVTDGANITITSNLLAGGAYSLYCPKNNNGPVTNNRVSKIYKPKGGEYGPWVYCDVAVPHTGNVWDETNIPLP